MDIVRVLLITLFSLSPLALSLSLAAEPDSESTVNTENISQQVDGYQVIRKGFGAEMPDDIGLFRVPMLGIVDGFGVRFAKAIGKFDGVVQQALFVDFRLPWRWSAWDRISVVPRLTAEVGRFEEGSNFRAFASFGPSLRLTSIRSRGLLFADIGLSPIVIDGADYDGQDFGTSLNLTTHVAFGLRFGRNRNQVVKLRFQHVSNAGSDRVNPGMNLVGIDFNFLVW